MPELPPDPFLPDDERIRDKPLVRYLLEGKSLAIAFSDSASLASLVTRLHDADKRDLELVALFYLTPLIEGALRKAASAEGLTEDQAHERLRRWHLSPPSRDSLDDLP